MQGKLDKNMPKEKEQALSVEEQLMAKFRLRDIEWVIVSATDFKYKDGGIGIKARATPYIKKESAERRADEVLGAFNWRNAFTTPDQHGRFTYKIEIRHPENYGGEWIPKIGGGSIDMNASGQFESNAFEIALSFAEKRVWSKIGIGRYLKLVPQMEVDVSEDWMDGWGFYSFKSKVEGTKQNPVWRKFYWQPPILDDDLLHEDDKGQVQTGKPKSTPVSSKEKSNDPPPKKNPPKEALKVQWNTIEAYYKALPDPEKDKWTNVLYKEDVEEGTGVIVATHRKTLTMEYAQKIIDSMKKGYGTLDEDEWPSKLEKPKKT